MPPDQDAAALPDAERLAAIAEIEQLKALRDLAVDTHDWALYEALHAPDHRSDNADYGQWTSAADMVANTRRAMRGLTTAHHSHTPIITFETPDRARGIWAMKGVSFWDQDGVPHWFLAFGHYHEAYERRDGAWRFTERSLRYTRTMRSPGAVFPPVIAPAKADDPASPR